MAVFARFYACEHNAEPLQGALVAETARMGETDAKMRHDLYGAL